MLFVCMALTGWLAGICTFDFHPPNVSDLSHFVENRGELTNFRGTFYGEIPPIISPNFCRPPQNPTTAAQPTVPEGCNQTAALRPPAKVRAYQRATGGARRSRRPHSPLSLALLRRWSPLFPRKLHRAYCTVFLSDERAERAADCIVPVPVPLRCVQRKGSNCVGRLFAKRCR